MFFSSKLEDCCFYKGEYLHKKITFKEYLKRKFKRDREYTPI